PVLDGFMAVTGLAAEADDPNARYRRFMFFMEGVPFFSKKSAPFRQPLRSLRLLTLNREALRLVLSRCPPRTILLNGKETHKLLDSNDAFGEVGPWCSQQLTGTTGNRLTCEIGRTVLRTAASGSIPVVRCNFIRTMHGPNSREQCFELGQLLA